jgi:hypothetical protein
MELAAWCAPHCVFVIINMKTALILKTAMTLFSSSLKSSLTCTRPTPLDFHYTMCLSYNAINEMNTLFLYLTMSGLL